MKVAFFSETGTNQKYPRDFPNARTEVAWCLALDAPMCALDVHPKEEHFDLGIVIIPKNNPKVSLDFIRGCCDKVAVMQEGPHWYFQDYDIDKQFHYYNTLMEADWVYCHNKSDVNYYLGLGCKDVRVMRSLMIPEELIPRNEWGDVTIIGGNFVSWYGGFDSYMVAREIGDPIVAPSMGRKQELENQIEDIDYLPYLTWREWIDNLSQYNIGVHLMRTHAAGTFAMNCAFHGIPCIGYEGLDTQETLHQHLSVKVGDLEKAKHLAVQLKNDDGFYQMCSNSSREMFKKFYTEQAWKANWEKTNK
jgi:hypothetical protein